MTTACRASFDRYVADVSTDHTNSLEAVTSIEVTADNATTVEGDGAVSDATITSAAADVDNRGQLIVAVASSARVHFITTDNATRRVTRTLSRTTTYTLTTLNTKWLLDAWQGTYDLSPVTAEPS